MIKKLKNTDLALPAFSGWQDTLIYSCTDGSMGNIYADSQTEPTCFMAVLGDFCCLAGRPEPELVAFMPPECRDNFLIMVPENSDWAALIEEVHRENTKQATRYALKKEGDIFDRERLTQYAAVLPEGYSLAMIDEPLYDACKRNSWSADFVCRYPTYADFERMGLGVLALKDGRPVAGASSYSSYREGIEIEIVTHPEHRRLGLARACGAALILACLERGLYPSWDARTKISLSLAEQLGYHFDREYTVYETKFK